MMNQMVGVELLLDSLGIPPEIRQHADRGWLLRAILDPSVINNPDGSKSSVRTATAGVDVNGKKKTMVYPTIRKQEDGSLRQLGDREAMDTAWQKRDAIMLNPGDDADALSRIISAFLGSDTIRNYKGLR